MIITFEEIVKETRFEEPVEAQRLDFGDGYSAEVEKTVLSLTAAPVKGGVHFSGGFQYRATAPCSRCLKLAKLEGEALFSLNYFPGPEALPAEEDREVPLEETEDIFTEEDGVTPESLVAQQLYLELPEKILCSESCQGLCLRCGADLNAGPCSCPPATDPRWEGLVSLNRSPEKE